MSIIRKFIIALVGLVYLFSSSLSYAFMNKVAEGVKQYVIERTQPEPVVTVLILLALAVLFIRIKYLLTSND